MIFLCVLRRTSEGERVVLMNDHGGPELRVSVLWSANTRRRRSSLHAVRASNYNDSAVESKYIVSHISLDGRDEDSI